MSLELLNKLQNDTLFAVEKQTVDPRFVKKLEFHRKEALTRSVAYIDQSGVKALTAKLNQLQLDAICNDFLQVQHKEGHNIKNKAVLTKRLNENIDERGVDKWFKNCTDIEILKFMAEALGIRAIPKNEDTAVSYIQKEAVSKIRQNGFQVILGRLDTAHLHDICEDMRLKNHQKTNSRNALILAISTNTDVVVPEPTIRVRVPSRKPSKRALEKCTEYEEIFQNYFLDELIEWCRENGLKTSGTKKVVINRILAFNNGDRENTMADIQMSNRRKVKRTSAAPEEEEDDEQAQEESVEDEEEEEEVEEEVKVVAKKSTGKKVVAKKGLSTRDAKKVTPAAKGKKVEKKVEQVEEDEEEEQEEETQEEEMTVDAERALRSTEQEDEEEAEEEEVNESNSSNASEEDDIPIKGSVVCLTGHMPMKRADLVRKIVAAGAKVAGSVTKEVTILIAEDAEGDSAKLKEARANGVHIYDFEYLSRQLNL